MPSEDHTGRHEDVLREIQNLRETAKDLYAKHEKLQDRVRTLEIASEGFSKEMKGELKLITEQNAKLEGMFTTFSSQFNAQFVNLGEKVSTIAGSGAKKTADTVDKLKIAGLSALVTGSVGFLLALIFGAFKGGN